MNIIDHFEPIHVLYNLRNITNKSVYKQNNNSSVSTSNYYNCGLTESTDLKKMNNIKNTNLNVSKNFNTSN